MAEDPPELLMDFQWPDRMHSDRFSKRFRKGTPEGELLDWLEQNEFEFAERQGVATRQYDGGVCSHSFEVSWTAENEMLLEDANADVTGYACL